MARLIDADKLIEYIQGSDDLLDFQKDECIECINACDTVTDDVCEWSIEDEEANLYVTECEQRQLIFEGTPKENGYVYCPYCGRKIEVV